MPAEWMMEEGSCAVWGGWHAPAFCRYNSKRGANSCTSADAGLGRITHSHMEIPSIIYDRHAIWAPVFSPNEEDLLWCSTSFVSYFREVKCFLAVHQWGAVWDYMLGWNANENSWSHLLLEKYPAVASSFCQMTAGLWKQSTPSPAFKTSLQLKRSQSIISQIYWKYQHISPLNNFQILCFTIILYFGLILLLF